ncbi:MAG: 16S rRNA (guanine(527)-N(7))-methyltransferase RsmG [Thermodesulfobacteriota bacterium]
MKLESLIDKGTRELGVHLDNIQIQKFINYLMLLKQWNNKVNITSITDDKDIVIKHFLDSLSVSNLLNNDTNLLDIGSGGGFPGLPLAIVQPELNVTLLDSVQKKAVFMKEVVRNLGLNNVEVVQGRAEDKKNKIKRNSFGSVITRAVSGIKEVLDLSLPYIKNDGKVLLMRGKEEEDSNSFISCMEKNGKYSLNFEKFKLRLPFSNYKRVVLIFKKVKD